MEVKIESVHFVSHWTWNMKGEDTCGICRHLFDAACPQCKVPGDDCFIVTGRCQHSFHMHCIQKWTEREPEGSQCPMCRQEWEFAS